MPCPAVLPVSENVQRVSGLMTQRPWWYKESFKQAPRKIPKKSFQEKLLFIFYLGWLYASDTRVGHRGVRKRRLAIGKIIDRVFL